MNAGLPRPVQRLIEAFARLPGIGPKTAARLTFFLLRAPEVEAQELAAALTGLRAETRFCSVCFHITETGADPCAVCTDETRDGSLVCVVEDMLDVPAIERTGQFRGRYHVLHGAISPVEGIGPDDLKIAELLRRLEPEGIGEVIMATNATLEGEATAMYIKSQLEGSGVRVTRLARGLPSGGDLEYADVTTLLRALEGRQEM
jgi:recombination protein RecR